jgi:hypothetical protein
LEFRSLASLVFWLDQEEELVQLVPEEFKELPVLSIRATEETYPSDLPVLLQKLFQVIVICRGCNRSE